MTKLEIAATAAHAVTDEWLKSGPGRLLTFLQGLTDPSIRVQFVPLGWSDAHLVEAWGLLDELKALSMLAPSPRSDRVEEAIAACEAWQATGLVRARAMLRLTCPEQAQFIFHDFEAGKGTAAVLNVSTFLQRRAALAKGVDRKATRKGDYDALVVLEDTGVTEEVAAKLANHVETVQTTVPEAPPAMDDIAAKRMETLRKIHAWLFAWGEMARTVVTRRDQLIRLGLARRRSRKAKARRSVAVTPPNIASPVQPGVQPGRESAGGSGDGDEPAPLSRAS